MASVGWVGLAGRFNVSPCRRPVLTHAGVFLISFEVEPHEDVVVALSLHVLDVIREAHEGLEAEKGEHFHGRFLFADEFGFKLLEADAPGDIDGFSNQRLGEAAAAPSRVHEDADAADMAFPAAELLMEGGGGKGFAIGGEAQQGEMVSEVEVAAPRGNDLGLGDAVFDEKPFTFRHGEEKVVQCLFIGGFEWSNQTAQASAEVQVLRIIFKHIVQHRMSRSARTLLCGWQGLSAITNFGAGFIGPTGRCGRSNPGNGGRHGSRGGRGTRGCRRDVVQG
jgi:hypothetical protein